MIRRSLVLLCVLTGFVASQARAQVVTPRPGDIIVGDQGSAKVLRLDPTTGAQSVVAQGGLLADGWFQPRGIAVDPNGIIYVSSRRFLPDGAVSGIIRIDPASGDQSWLTSGSYFGRNAFGVVVTDAGLFAIGEWFYGSGVVRVDTTTGAQTLVAALPTGAFGLAVDGNRNLIAVTDDFYDFMYRVDPSTGSSTLITRDGEFTALVGVSVAADGSIFGSDTSYERAGVVRVDPVTAAQTRIAQSNRVDSASLLNRPVAIAASGTRIIAAEPFDSRLVAVDTTTGAQSIFASGGNVASPFAITVVPGPLAPTVTTSISSNFNGTAIAQGRNIWFNSVLTVSGLGTQPVTIDVTGQKVFSQYFNVSVPDAHITFDPSATTATTAFVNGAWVTRVPSRGLSGNVFLAGVPLAVSTALPGGINPVAWSGTVSTTTPGVKVNWKWAAAVYYALSSDGSQLGVKAVDDGHASVYQNSDHAGTPEAFKSFVIGGARGGGGSNYTGGYSGTASIAF